MKRKEQCTVQRRNGKIYEMLHLIISFSSHPPPPSSSLSSWNEKLNTEKIHNKKITSQRLYNLLLVYLPSSNIKFMISIQRIIITWRGKHIERRVHTVNEKISLSSKRQGRQHHHMSTSLRILFFLFFICNNCLMILLIKIVS